MGHQAVGQIHRPHRRVINQRGAQTNVAQVSVAGRMRYADRIGIVPRLLVCSLLAILLAVAAGQVWTLRSVAANGLRQAQDALTISMALLRHELDPLGAAWSVTADGQMLLGTTKLNGRSELVDTVKHVTGASVTIFLGDMRVATNIKSPDGSRGIGTKLAAGAAHDAVLRDGRSYNGPATILGIPYLAVYEPIRNAQAQIIGILFVGVPLDSAEAFMSRITTEAVIGGLVVVLLAGLGYLWTLRINVKPLQSLASVMHRIADGALDSAVPFAMRTDQIGEIARALLHPRTRAPWSMRPQHAPVPRRKNMPPFSAWWTGSRKRRPRP